MSVPEVDSLSELREQLKFETLLVGMSTRFVNLPADRIDDAIKETQRRVCEYLDIDRSALWQFSDNEPGKVLLTHIQQLREAPLPSGPVDARSTFPWVLEQMLRRETVVLSRLADLPPEASCDRKSFQRWGTRSSVVVPLLIGGKVAGALSFSRIGMEGDWPARDVDRFLSVARVFASALLRKRAEASLQDRLKFESMLADISTRFVNLPVEKIDGEIEDAHRRVCECFGLDFSTLWQMSIETPRNYVLTHSYRLVDGPALPERMTADEYFPWCLAHVEAGDVIAVSTEEVPAEAERDREVWRHYGIKSSLIVPLSIGGEPPIGAVSFDTIKAERTWLEPIVKQLQLVAHLFANALTRKRSDLALRETETRLTLAADSAEAGFWELDCDTNLFWVTARALKIFGFGPDEAIHMQRFEAAVHPDDLELVRQAIALAIANGEPLSLEYRIRMDNGDEKWIASRGRPYANPTGEADRLLGVSIDISKFKRMERELKDQLNEIMELKHRLENENLVLRKDLSMEQGLESIVGKSKAFTSVLIAAKQVASTDATVLLIGETGTGKGMIANVIHQMSARKNRPLVTVNCSALPQNLIESELFGREKGAFTGAHASQAGRFEVADGGTIFLDEIGEMPLEMQSKLLRVLQEGEFERLGSAKTVKTNVRVIAATNRDLKQEVRQRRFREDLYYRLNVFPISIPPLRQRTDDIPLLAQFFTQKYARKVGRPIDSIPRAAMNTFLAYDWPGNVRELEHVIERGVIITSGHMLQIAGQLTSDLLTDANHDSLKDLSTVEREHILKVLRETDWRIEGFLGAAAVLKIHPSTLRFRIKKLGIRRPS
ncbi:MAG: sigma 54-interacting transcriptional regulator [Desulfobacterales bacterium]